MNGFEALKLALTMIRMSYISKFIAVFLVFIGYANAADYPKTAIVLNSGEATVNLIDMARREVVKKFYIGKEPHHLMITPDQKAVLVANATGNEVVFLNPITGEKMGQIPHIIDPYHINYSPDKKFFIAAGNRLDRVDIYAAKDQDLTLLKVIKAPKTPSHISFTSNSKTAFVTLQDSDELISIDLEKLEVNWKMPVGHLPAGVWMTPGDKYLLVGLTGSDAVQVIDWRNKKVIKEIKTGKGAHNFRPMGDKRHIFVSNRVEPSISLLDMEKLEKVADIRGLPMGPDDMDITADGKEMWVTFRFAKKVGVIDLATRQLITTIPVGKSPHGIFFYPSAPWQ